ncbi:MAG: hypothetical protein OXH08_07300 [Gammaproteobacteria bacterium]|nr:hypothetical protein [Gammaproteobacteria bacterium]MDE2716310.1 hypothetical protein [Chloroflexota bacterium]
MDTSNRAALVPDQLRADVWKGRLHSARLSRYYGSLAGKLARQTRNLMIGGCVLAFASPYVSALSELASVACGLAGVTLALVTLSRGHQRIISAMFMQNQLENLETEWTALWQQVEDGETGPSDASDRWKHLSNQLTAITAQSSQYQPDNELKASTEADAYNYHAKDANVATVTREALSPSS